MKVLVAAAVLAFSSVSSFASPTDLPSVLTHCGTPDNDATARSEVSGLPQRTLTYGDVRINFQRNADATGWNFVDGWIGHLPATRVGVGRAMPCVNDALDEAAIQQQNALASADPAIAQQSAQAMGLHGAFGVRNLWLIVFLAAILAIFAVALPRRRRMVNGPDVKQRPFRRPNLRLATVRRRPKVFPVQN